MTMNRRDLLAGIGVAGTLVAPKSVEAQEAPLQTESWQSEIESRMKELSPEAREKLLSLQGSASIPEAASKMSERFPAIDPRLILQAYPSFVQDDDAATNLLEQLQTGSSYKDTPTHDNVPHSKGPGGDFPGFSRDTSLTIQDLRLFGRIPDDFDARGVFMNGTPARRGH